MSIATELTRIQSDRNTIRNKLIELGMAASSDKLDKLADTIEGIVNQGAVSITVMEGDTYTIPKGYHNGNGTVSGVKGGGNYTLQAKTATPTKKQQNITPDNGFYGLSGVTVAAIPEAYQDVTSVTAGAEDVLTGKVYVTKDGVVTAGEMPNLGAVNKTLDAVTVTYTIPKGFHSGSGVVKLVLETKTVTPTKEAQEITPSTGKVLSKVTVDPIPDEYQDVSGVTAKAGEVLSGSTFVDATGQAVTGTMKDWRKHPQIPGSPPETGDIKLYPLGNSDNRYLTYKVGRGYHDGDTTVSVPSVKYFTVTPSKQDQYVQALDETSPTGRVYIEGVVVEPIPSEYQDTTGVTAAAADVLSGKVIVTQDGAVTGSMANNGDISETMDGLNSTSVTIPLGYTTGGTISLTNDIENALKAI